MWSLSFSLIISVLVFENQYSTKYGAFQRILKFFDVASLSIMFNAHPLYGAGLIQTNV